MTSILSIACACATSATTVRPLESTPPAGMDDPIDRAIAQLRADLTPLAINRAHECRESADRSSDLPLLHIAFSARPTPIAEVIARRLEVAFSQLEAFRTTRLRDARSVVRAHSAQVDDHFAPETVASFGGFHGADAIGIVAAIDGSGHRTTVTVHLTCARTLIDLASAEVTIAVPSTYAATARLPAQDPRIVACSAHVTPGNTRDWMCCVDPELPACTR